MQACGECRFFRRHTYAADGTWLGDCRHQPQRGDFGPEAPICGSFLSINAPLPTSMPVAPTRQRSRLVSSSVEPLVRHPAPASAPASLGPSPAAGAPSNLDLREITDMNREELKAVVREALQETETSVELAPKWEGGVVILKPRDPALQARELPIDSLLHKVVMIRDRLRVLEQKINGHEKMSDAEKVDLQQYVTRCYGSLTTFNQLFRDKRDFFVGEKGSE